MTAAGASVRTAAGGAAGSAAATPGGAFRRGCGNASPLVLVLAVAVAFAMLGGLQWWFASGRFTVIPEPRFLRGPQDDWGHVSYEVGLLKRRAPSRTGVYLMGGSNMRECIQSNESLQGAIRDRCGLETTVRDLANTNQNLGETMAIVDNLPRAPAVLVIGLNHTRFAYAPDEVERQVSGRELLLRTPALERFAESQGHRKVWASMLPGIMSYATSWFQKHRDAIESGHRPWTPYNWHRYNAGAIWSVEKKKSRVERWVGNRGAPGGDFDTNFAYNAALLEALVKLGTERGFVVVLLEVPENREIVGDSFDRYKQAYRPLCRELAAEYGAEYVDFVADVGLVNTEFRDLTHLVQPGRDKWTQSLAEALCPVLERYEGGGALP